MGELVFDEEVAAQLEAVYRTRDVLRRRRLVIEALAPQPGEAIVDVGCGPGFYVEELTGLVGDGGSVVGVDPAPAMLAMTERRVGAIANARVAQGEATSLPLPDGSADAALSVQVFEYVPDTAAGLAELRRVVRPGGRVVLWDIDWSTLSWHAQDVGRMQRMREAWDRHLVHRELPRTLGASLRDAGFADVRCEGHLFASTALDPQTFGGNLPLIIAKYVQGAEDAVVAEVEPWLADLAELDARGAYFFSLTQFCFTAARPA